MKKSRAILLLITLLVVIGGYVAWAAWEPAPTIQSMFFFSDVDAGARSAAEADFRAHPPKRKLTWQRFWHRLVYPYRPPYPSMIPVSMIDEVKLAILYPRGHVYLRRDEKDGSWYRAFE